ncbi:YHYH protein [Flavobacterium sp. LMO8]|uniref:YHYH protein n=1 Tax=Flavobacterium sp. LMO8 TaxID=2654244 RepID=UPI001291F539|nr:YHYH protein [Flavobacterium sp. LMO8]MQP24234.1 YHYH protein [Flavobacterium sp. LMO8]
MKTKSIFFNLLFIGTVFVGCKSQKELNTNQDIKAIDFTKAYTINNSDFGTKTSMTISNEKRILKTNSLPNHKTGSFPNEGNPNTISEQKLTYTFPLNPVLTGHAKWAREFGVAVNGIKFEPETAERFECETGETYRIEAKQDEFNLGLDFNNAHVQPTGAYHYHGIPLELIVQLDNGEDLILIGYANDGFPIYYSKSENYKPSFRLSKNPRTGEFCTYSNPKQSTTKNIENTDPNGIFVSDWEYIEGSGDLDECNGTMLNGNYVYFATMSYPYIGRCLKGAFSEKRPNGPPPGMRNNKNDKPRK